jgi:hypothetical protein
VSVEILQPHPALVAVPLLMIVLGLVAGVVPAIRAYTTDVASNLVQRT